MTRIQLIAAHPTPWDDEDRVVGNHSLPLTPEGRQALLELIDRLPVINAVYRCKTNEACDETAKLIAHKFHLRPGHRAELDEMKLGLWQGLRRDEIKFRFPKVVELWERQPLAVEPPEGEMIPEAFDRLKDGVRSILKRNRGTTIALALRPISLQLVAALLHREPLMAAVQHLQTVTPWETIQLTDEDVWEVIG